MHSASNTRCHNSNWLWLQIQQGTLLRTTHAHCTVLKVWPATLEDVFALPKWQIARPEALVGVGEGVAEVQEHHHFKLGRHTTGNTWCTKCTQCILCTQCTQCPQFTLCTLCTLNSWGPQAPTYEGEWAFCPAHHKQEGATCCTYCSVHLLLAKLVCWEKEGLENL